MYICFKYYFYEIKLIPLAVVNICFYMHNSVIFLYLNFTISNDMGILSPLVDDTTAGKSLIFLNTLNYVYYQIIV